MVEMAIFKRDQMKQIRKNQENFKSVNDYTTVLSKNMGGDKLRVQSDDPQEQIIEIRYNQRFGRSEFI